MENSDPYLFAYASKTNEEDSKMNISEKEAQKTVEYQETLKIDVENIDKNIKTIWIPIYEVIDDLFLKKQNISTSSFRLM